MESGKEPDMKRKNKIYLYILILAAVVIFLLVLGLASSGKRNPGTNKSHAGHSAGSADTGNSAEDEINNSTESKPSSLENGSVSPTEQTARALSLYLSEQDEIMAEMMEDMNVEPSGNASVDFLEGMIPHHESAIEMAESYLKYGGTNQELKQLAQDIIDAQTGEIEQMERLIEEIEASGAKDEEKERGYLNAYEKMMSAHSHMGHGTSSASDVENAFAEGMLMHHQMAVEMAEAIYEYTDHDEVRKLAEDIVSVQKKEIEQMEQLLKQYQ